MRSPGRHSRHGSVNWSGKTATWPPSPNPCCGSGECSSMNLSASTACVDSWLVETACLREACPYSCRTSGVIASSRVIIACASSISARGSSRLQEGDTGSGKPVHPRSCLGLPLCNVDAKTARHNEKERCFCVCAWTKPQLHSRLLYCQIRLPGLKPEEAADDPAERNLGSRRARDRP